VQTLFGGNNVNLGLSTRLDTLNNNSGVRTSDSGADIHFVLHNGSNFDLSVAGVSTLGDFINLVNTTSNNKVKATLGASGNLVLTDTTSGGVNSTFSVSSLNGSNALADLGLDENAQGSILTGASLVPQNQRVNHGIGGVIADAVTKLTDPVSGIITRENTTLDNQTQEFNNRISDLNDLIAQKKQRLEEQFANMESVLAQLQSQQSALGSITSIKPAAASSSSSKAA
jgi:hypothetical protein